MKIEWAKKWNSISQLWQKFYPITITPAVIDSVRNQHLTDTLADIFTRLNHLSFSDVYIGVGATAASVMVSGNHHDSMSKGDHVSLTASSSYIWVILPSTYNPILTMTGLEIPMTAQSSITENNVTYKVLKSNNSYTGTFNTFIF